MKKLDGRLVVSMEEKEVAVVVLRFWLPFSKSLPLSLRDRVGANDDKTDDFYIGMMRQWMRVFSEGSASEVILYTVPT